MLCASWGASEAYLKRTIWGWPAWKFLLLGQPDGFLASDFPGLARSPQLPARPEPRLQPEGFWPGPCSTAPSSLSLGFRVKGLAQNAFIDVRFC